jgi:tetratricopeptide (TPR) repeat protein
MSPDLLDILKNARGRRELAIFAATAPTVVHLSARLLAVTISSSPTRLRQLMSETWPDLAEAAPAAIEQLSAWPFVVAPSEAEWRVYPDIASSLKSEFRHADARAFIAVNDRLTQLEEATAAQDETEQARWQADARAAYYRSAVDQDDAVDRFGASFIASPPLERTRARAWLGELVARQRSMLSSHARVVAFFEAFAIYRHSHKKAKPLLEVVIASDSVDVYQAVALHLYGVVILQQKRGEAVDAFRRSVAMSLEVGIPDNEIMARNSLAWALVEHGQEHQKTREAALVLAEENVARAETTGEWYLIKATLFTAAAIEWSVLTEARRSRPSQQALQAAPRILASFQAIVEADRDEGDVPSAVRAFNELALVRRDMGALDEALTTLEEAEAWLAGLHGHPSEVDRLVRTAKSIRDRAKSADERKRAQRLRQAFQAFLEGSRS